LEWRTKKLENRLLGYTGKGPNHRHHDGDLGSVSQKIKPVAELYENFLTTPSGESFLKFLELQRKSKELLSNLEKCRNSDIGEAAKADLVLAYENDLTRHFESLKMLEEKADKVLDDKNWPDFSGLTGRLEKLKTITKEQHLQSVNLDQKTEALVELYNEIITSFRGNISMWNQRLDAYELQDRNPDEDVE